MLQLRAEQQCCAHFYGGHLQALNRWLLNFTHNYRNQATALKLPLLQSRPVVQGLSSLPSAQLVPCHPEQREGSMQLTGRA